MNTVSGKVNIRKQHTLAVVRRTLHNYAFKRMFRFLNKKHLYMTLALACALATIWLMWLENYRLLSVEMPRFLAVSCSDIILLPKRKDRSVLFLGCQ